MPNDRFHLIFPEPILAEIKNEYEIIDAPMTAEVDDDYIRAYIGQANIVVTSWGTPPLTEKVLKGADSVEFVAHAAGTVKPIVSDTMWDMGIRITSSAKAIADGVAEFTLGLMLTCSKRTFWFAEDIRRGYWSKRDDVFGAPFEIYRQKAGLIGAGYVGRKVIELLKPFKPQILLFDPYCGADDAKKMGVEKVDTLDDIFSQCRVVSLHAPITDETKGMIHGKHFAQLPDGALFINTARGVIIQQQEMVDELAKGRFVACLDVTNPEPPSLDHPLRKLPNVILTPHIAGAISENLGRIGEFVLTETRALYKGTPLAGEVTRESIAFMA